jgi:putative ABC transport system permease protein
MIGVGVWRSCSRVAVLGPSIAAPLSGIIGLPIRRVKGITGSIARERAMRNPDALLRRPRR